MGLSPLMCKASLIIFLSLLLIQNSHVNVACVAFAISSASAASRATKTTTDMLSENPSTSEAEDAAAYNSIFSSAVDLTSSYVRNNVLTGNTHVHRSQSMYRANDAFLDNDSLLSN